MFEDLFSSKEGDFNEMLERIDHAGISPKEYFEKFFFSYLGNASINNGDIDEDYLNEALKKSKNHVSFKDINGEMVKGKHPILVYIATWREDVRMFAYSKKLSAAVRLLNDYEK